VKDRPAYRSYSQLDQWMTCGEQFRLARRVGIKEKPSVWLPGGTAFHTTSEHIDHDTLLDGSIQRTWEAEFDKAIQAQLDSLKTDDLWTVGYPPEWRDPKQWRAADKGKEDLDWWRVTGAAWCQGYADWRESSQLEIYEHGDVTLIETELMPILHGVPVKMFPDRIMVDRHGQLLVVDLKTGKPANLSASGFQFGVYKVGVEKLLGVSIEWGAYYASRKGELMPPIPIGHWTEDRVGSLFAMFDRQERAGEYLPNIGSHCKYMCSFKAHCVYQGGTRHPEDDG
jgi:hypothetical protein